jgi:hypothetical protein
MDPAPLSPPPPIQQRLIHQGRGCAGVSVTKRKNDRLVQRVIHGTGNTWATHIWRFGQRTVGLLTRVSDPSNITLCYVTVSGVRPRSRCGSNPFRHFYSLHDWLVAAVGALHAWVLSTGCVASSLEEVKPGPHRTCRVFQTGRAISFIQGWTGTKKI